MSICTVPILEADEVSTGCTNFRGRAVGSAASRNHRDSGAKISKRVATTQAPDSYVDAIWAVLRYNSKRFCKPEVRCLGHATNTGRNLIQCEMRLTNCVQHYEWNMGNQEVTLKAAHTLPAEVTLHLEALRL